MPSFDLVSSMDMGELKNAINMAQKQISGRYDFKGAKCDIILKNDNELEIIGESEYQVKTALSILYNNMGKRGLSLKGIDPQDINPSGLKLHKQQIIVRSGIDKEKGKIINKIIKDSKLKITSQYLDEKIRLTGKKIDDLQSAFKLLKEHKDIDIPLGMENMK
ncbi:MAG: YajQ family cyclic di-GMP-binding protein [Halobacteriovoraceae bacterium]|nr:YajQ family cyclic di-GMP-binding protein [Halobacteriovoraceae bacterium]